MADFAYTTVPGKIKSLLNKIRQAGVPKKANSPWLKSVGFTSSNDGSLLTVLRYINFIDTSSVPTEIWNQFRGNDYKKVLGAAIKKGYAELFSIYPDANVRAQSEIEHVFKTSSTAGNQVIAKTLATFRALVEEAEFSTDKKPPASLTPDVSPPAPEIATSPAQLGPPNASLHIDIQIHISPKSSAEQINQIFESMAKHLYRAKK